jgi:hypothetical protein
MPSTVGIVASGVVEFSPADLPQLQLWLDAADSSTVTVSGTSVTAWNDKSGNGYNVAQGNGASQPTLITAGQNGRNVISFDGSNDSLNRLASTALGRNVTGLTAYTVSFRSALPVSQQVILLIATAQAANFTRVALNVGLTANKMGAGGRTLDADSFASIASSSNVSTTNYQIFTGRFDYANTDLFVYINSALEGTNSSFQMATTTSNTNSVGLAIGNNNAASLHYNGRIAEILVYHQAHDATQRQQVWDYLSAKWGITL